MHIGSTPTWSNGLVMRTPSDSPRIVGTLVRTCSGKRLMHRRFAGEKELAHNSGSPSACKHQEIVMLTLEPCGLTVAHTQRTNLVQGPRDAEPPPLCGLPCEDALTLTPDALLLRQEFWSTKVAAPWPASICRLSCWCHGTRASSVCPHNQVLAWYQAR